MNEAKKTHTFATAAEKDGLLEEYRTLRSEILNAQGRRLQTISLTVGAFGVILSVTAGAVLGSDITSPETRLLVSIGGAVALYAVLIPSLIMIISTQQTVQRLGEYIRIFIEPRIPGLNWEHRWYNFKRQRRFKGGLRSTGTIYYFLSLVPLLLPLYAASQNAQNWLLLLILVPFVCWAIYLTYDLQAAISVGWKWSRWDDYKELDSKEGTD